MATGRTTTGTGRTVDLERLVMGKRASHHDNIVVISDTHCGCRLGLCHPDGATLDDGGTYQPSKFQRKLYSMWRKFWDEFVPEATHGEPFSVVHNGDAIDGVHHNSTTQVSHNMGDQVAIAYKLLQPVVAACEGRYYHIRGTEAHVGKSGLYEEQLAKQLGAIPNADGQHARYELWKQCGPNGLVHFLHHIGTTSSSGHEASAVNAELAAAFVEAARWGEKPPDVTIRSHRHRYMEVRFATSNGYGISAVTAGWQGKTPFAWKIAGARLSPPQFGGVVVRRGERRLYIEPQVWTVERGEVA